MGRTLALLAAGLLLAGCSTTGLGTPPTSASSRAPLAPNDGASALPGTDGASALPGSDGASALPGTDGASALPGVVAACDPNVATGSASCSLALSVNAGAIDNAQLPASAVPGYHPPDLQAAYGLSGGAGGTVAIVDAYDDPALEADMNVYRATFGIAPCTTDNGCFRKLDEHGGTSYPAFNMGWAEELSLDVEMVSAICPQCKILVVEANSASLDDLGSAVDTAVAQGARVVSNSYYAPEWNGETAYDVHYDRAGVAMTASSGDAMYVSYPAASPYVTAVGGTTLTGSQGAFTQTPWSNTGHGCSRYETRPSWQNGAACSNRAAVDVAVVADPNHGVATFDASAGGWLVAGGTSVGAPIVAAAYAMAANGETTSYAYAHRGAFQAIESGAYGTYTGLGSPLGLGGF